MAKSAITSGLKKLEEAWQDKDYYTAQQVYKTLYARFVYFCSPNAHQMVITWPSTSHHFIGT